MPLYSAAPVRARSQKLRADADTTELSRKRRILILGICCTSLLLVSLDSTILNVALPVMQRDLGASLSGMQWTVDAYTLVLASLLMVAGSAADRIGRRKVFTMGLITFSLGSALCSVAPDLRTMILFRVLQAIGGSMLNPVAMSIITTTFTVPRQRARAIGVWGSVFGLAMAAGPLLGGLLVDTVGWRAVFLINIPVGAIALWAALRHIPESRAPAPRRPDPIGQLLVTGLLGTVTYAIIEAPGKGWTSAEILACLVSATVSLLGLLGYESRRDEPLLDLRFFRSAPFSGAVVIAVAGFVVLGGFLFLNTLYLQNVRGLDALHAGLYLLPMAAFMLISPPASSRLIASYGPRPSLVLSGAAMALGSVLFAACNAEESRPLLFLGYCLLGIGVGMVNAPITNTAVSGMPLSQAGVASAVATTSRQVGQALGVAVIGAVLAHGTRNGTGSAYPETFADAARPAWWVITGCGVAVLLVGAASSGRWAQESAERTARLFEETGTAGPAGGAASYP
ncbi:MFS transporter [Streptomyces chrestomyceticus]|uniref:MFS transporter n=1 Tax=Streptomyces chrestomyceticus TaxID=68185 RepID=UPI0035A90694